MLLSLLLGVPGENSGVVNSFNEKFHDLFHNTLGWCKGEGVGKGERIQLKRRKMKRIGSEWKRKFKE